ncbi:SapC family protein [Methylocapsa sp. S129]|uniref:SapC family protein n=1 Tax=Methylocapsa sp. S129 TaxID=1641869 RepID=UPI00131A6D3F|nr:SapC family protein [Methylocapsa sp. S129]
MVDNPLFYQSIVPLNRERHRSLRLKHDGQQFAFAAKTHIIPAVIDEFPAASRHLPIVFVPASPLPTSVFLVGLRPGQNVFVDGDGKWTEGYIPAFARRYPFMLGEMEQGGPVACIDEKYDGFGAKTGERLFGDDGGDSPFLQERIKLTTDYFAAAKRTDAFLRTLNDLQLMRQVTIESKAELGSSAILHGFLTIDEAKLNALSDEDFLRLRKEGLLPAIYAHLLSLASIDRLQRASAASDAEAKALGELAKASPAPKKALQLQ